MNENKARKVLIAPNRRTRHCVGKRNPLGELANV